MHLTSEELVDIAEGDAPESAAPHLLACERCRAQVDDLRALMPRRREVDVPEPSPLFWDHLSPRVSTPSAAEARAGRPRLAETASRAVLATAAAVAAALL